jgi:hypothetical protein
MASLRLVMPILLNIATPWFEIHFVTRIVKAISVPELINANKII